MRMCGEFMLTGQLGERVFIGGEAGLGFPKRLEAKILEQHRGQLFGRADIELTTGEPMDGADHLIELSFQFSTQRAQALNVEQEPIPFNLDQHRDQRHFDVFKQGQAALLPQSFAQQRRHLLAVTAAASPDR